MKSTIHPHDFLVKPGEKLKLKDRQAFWKDLYDGSDAYENDLKEYKEEIFKLQNIMLAHDKYALLLIFQGMDCSGKDGAISHVVSGINSHGVHVSSFKKPTPDELDHDYLWRCTNRLPERGRIGIFNRSYYEEVLIVKVHPEILAGQRIPKEFLTDKDLFKKRYEDIRNFEHYLYRNGIIVVKFFLHISRDEQKKRFLERIEEPEKNWKFSVFDVQERKYWDAYQQAFEEALEATSAKHSPWYVIPANKKKTARLILSQIVLSHIKQLYVEFPELSAAQKSELQKIREELLNEE